MVSAPDVELLELQERLNSLPRELYDRIAGFVLVPDIGTVTIDKHYKHPVQLQIDHATRERAATRYYTNTIFVSGLGKSHSRAWFDWLVSIPDHHRQQIRKYHYKTRKPKATGYENSLMRAYFTFESIMTCCVLADVAAERARVFVNVKYEEDGVVKEIWKHGEELGEAWMNSGLRDIRDVNMESSDNEVDDDDDDSTDGED